MEAGIWDQRRELRARRKQVRLRLCPLGFLQRSAVAHGVGHDLQRDIVEHNRGDDLRRPRRVFNNPATSAHAAPATVPPSKTTGTGSGSFVAIPAAVSAPIRN